jgi:hypothetical protein
MAADYNRLTGIRLSDSAHLPAMLRKYVPIAIPATFSAAPAKDRRCCNDLMILSCNPQPI